jgi:hypothetical protein
MASGGMPIGAHTLGQVCADIERATEAGGGGLFLDSH